jgi:hypothetical protein
MIADGIKYMADLIISIVSTSAGAGKNYKQLPLPLAIFVCIVTGLVLGLLGFVGVTTLLSYLS